MDFTPQRAAIGVNLESTLATDLAFYVGHWSQHVVNFGHVVSNDFGDDSDLLVNMR